MELAPLIVENMPEKGDTPKLTGHFPTNSIVN